MADEYARIRVDVDTTAALANIKALQRQISTFHTSMAKGSADAATASRLLQQKLVNSINATGQFSASMKNIKTSTESFTSALESNRLSMGEYFRYAGGSTKTFGRLFRSEFDTINKVARERVKDLQTQYIKMGRDANGAMRAIAIRPLVLDMENLGTRTAIAAQRQQLLNQLLKQGSTNLLNFGKNTQWAGRQLMVGFTIPLTMFGALAAKTFMDLEKQAIRFKRVYGELFTTTEETNKALDDIRKLANEFTKYGVAVEKTMELAADAAAMGKMGADLTAQVAEATRLAVLGGVEQQEALKTTISLTNAFGVATEDLARKTDFLNAVENQTVVSIEDLTIAIPKAGPVVQQLGGDVEDLAFFLTAMKEGGINASEGANALKSGLASLINPTGVASKMLEGFGINIQGIVEANKGDVKGLVIDFASALDELDPLNRARAIEQLFGKFQFARISTLFKNVIAEGNQASRVLELTAASSAELAVLSERELKKVEDSPMFKFQKTIEDLKVSLAPLGEAFLKAVTPLVEFGTEILKKFKELDEGTKNLIVNLVGFGGVIAPVFLMGFGLVANGVANLIKMFTFIKTVFNKAGGSATILGQNVEYMTQQQLEAAAIASSLDQVHSKLIQTFTSEAGAINNLTTALERATVAQGKYTGVAGVAATGRGKAARKKYASGVVSVPGPKGAGDIVPAMLAPGEAVIPANMAKQYAPLIKGMVAGNIPGFSEGTEEIKKRYAKKVSGTGFTSAPTEVSDQTKKMVWASMDAELQAKKDAAAEWERKNKTKLTQSQKAIVFKTTPDAAHIRDSSGIANIAGQQTSFKSWKAKNLLADDSMINRFAGKASFGEGGTNETRAIVKNFMLPQETQKLAKELSVSTKEVSSTLKNLSKGISPKTESGLKVLQAVAQKDSSYYAATASAAAQARMDFAKQNPNEGFYETANKRKYESKLDDKIIASQEKRIANYDKQAKEEIKQTSKTTKASKVEEKAKAKSAKATEEETKTKKASTAAAKKEQDAAKRSAAARKGWETRRAAASVPTAITPASPRSRMAGRAPGVAGAIGGAAIAGGSMAAGLDPFMALIVGQMAYGPIKSLFVKLGANALKILGPIGLAASALAGIGIAFYNTKKAMDEAAKSAREMSQSLGPSSSALQGLAEFAGTATPGEIMTKMVESWGFSKVQID